MEYGTLLPCPFSSRERGRRKIEKTRDDTRIIIIFEIICFILYVYVYQS